MKISLAQIKSSLQGIYPVSFYTCSKEGVPNVNFISHIHYVDETHLAISGQFLNKTKKNLLENPTASAMLLEPTNMCHYEAILHWEGSETEGPVFDAINERIEAIDSMVGGKGNFKLQTIEIFKVVSLEVPVEFLELYQGKTTIKPFSLQNLQKALSLIQTAETLEELYDTILSSLEEAFGFKHSLLLIPDETKNHLITISSRGYAENGAGSEVKIGEGVAGKVAELKRPLAFMGLKREFIYAGISLSSAIEFPSLPDALSQIAIPLISRGELMGVLQVESIHTFDFKDSDEEFLMTFGGIAAFAIENFLMRQDQIMAKGENNLLPPISDSNIQVSYYSKDECIMIDGEYLVRSLPAKLLLKLLRAFLDKGQTEFTNRELRLDSTLQLPEFKDNLETRLILLRKRLEQKCPAIALTSSGRGKFRLSVTGKIRLEEI